MTAGALRDEAQAEFDEAFDHYAGKQAALGVDFAASGAYEEVSIPA